MDVIKSGGNNGMAGNGLKYHHRRSNTTVGWVNQSGIVAGPSQGNNLGSGQPTQGNHSLKPTTQMQNLNNSGTSNSAVVPSKKNT